MVTKKYNNPKKHSRVKQHTRYELKSGTYVPGITTIVGQMNKPALVGWANKLGLEGINAGKYVDELADIGTIAHNYIEAKLKGKEFDSSEFSAKQLECAKVCINKFNNWYNEATMETILCEQPLVSEKYGYGGTLDWYGKINGKKTLLDWKTGSGFYEEHKMQLSGNKQLLEEHGHVVEQQILIGIGRAEWESTHIERVDGMAMRFKKVLNLLEIYNINKSLKV